MSSGVRRRSPRKHKTTEPKPKKDKQVEPALPSIKWKADDGALVWSLITQMEVKENRLVLFGKQNQDENTSGDSKIAVYKRIGGVILPDIFAKSPNALAKRVKGKAEDLVSQYKTLAKELQVTGGGLRSEDDDNPDDTVHQFLDCYITAEGPDHDTTQQARNLWESITERFEYFPALHRFLAARSNIVPPVITTGIGPEGRKVVHLQPPTQKHNKADDNIDPSLQNMSTPHRSHGRTPESSPVVIDSSPLAPVVKGKTRALPSTFKTPNANKFKVKKSFEDSLVEIQSSMLISANAREQVKLEHEHVRLEHESARLRLQENNQLLELHKIGVLDVDLLRERLKVVEDRYAPRKRPHYPNNDEAGPSKRRREHSRTGSSSDLPSSSQWDGRGSSPVPGSDRTLGYR